MRRWGSRLLLIGCCLLTVIWVIATIASDRWWWSQWLLWLTSLILFPAGLMGMTGLRLGQNKAWWCLSGLSILGLLLFLGARWGTFQRNTQPAHDLRVMQWTAGHAYDEVEQHAGSIAAVDADLTIVEGGRRIVATDTFKRWSAGFDVALKGGFVIASKVPIESLKTKHWADDIILVELIVRWKDSPIRLLVVDLPSNPIRSRDSIAKQVRGILEDAGEVPQILIGDFNLTASSWQLRHLAPDRSPIWNQVGMGWGGTFPRSFPIYRLDHVLASPEMTDRLSVSTIDPGVGRHRAQILTLQESE